MKHDGYSQQFIDNAVKAIKQRNKVDVNKKIPTTIEELSKPQKKELKQRALKKVFGRVGDVFDRANKLFKENGKNPDDLINFFWIDFKMNFWFGLLSKTSKIAPRHARLTVMYLGVAM